VPAAVSTTERQVEHVRGLRYLHPVAVDAVTHRELARRITELFDQSFPATLYQRRTLAWRTMQVIPPTADIRRALRTYISSQVVGFYDTQSKQLVFIGSSHPNLIERITLAHELTHALDDQHFDLRRLDRLSNACADERVQAASGAVEGSAQFFMCRVAERYSGGLPGCGLVGGGASGVPRFIEEQTLWPYTAGLPFIRSVYARGGLRAVDRALRHLPVSTEQVMHPARYPADAPVRVDVPNVTAGLGSGWRDLDVMEVGEEWLHAMLDLRLDFATTARAAAGWDGGTYRAWTDGHHIAVEMVTRWDTQADAAQFAGAFSKWVGSGQFASARSLGATVTVLFASDRHTFDTFPFA
jgi:hypothetical protein